MNPNALKSKSSDSRRRYSFRCRVVDGEPSGRIAAASSCCCREPSGCFAAASSCCCREPGGCFAAASSCCRFEPGGCFAAACVESLRC